MTKAFLKHSSSGSDHHKRKLLLWSKVDAFIEFSTQEVSATATSHVRGTTSKTPSEFKQVIYSIMSERLSRQEWGEIVEQNARAYHKKQVLLDYSCFNDDVDSMNISMDKTAKTLSRMIRTMEQIRLLERKDIGEKQRFLMTMARLRKKHLSTGTRTLSIRFSHGLSCII